MPYFFYWSYDHETTCVRKIYVSALPDNFFVSNEWLPASPHHPKVEKNQWFSFEKNSTSLAGNPLSVPLTQPQVDSKSRTPWKWVILIRCYHFHSALGKFSMARYPWCRYLKHCIRSGKHSALRIIALWHLEVKLWSFKAESHKVALGVGLREQIEGLQWGKLKFFSKENHCFFFQL